MNYLWYTWYMVNVHVLLTMDTCMSVHGSNRVTDDHVVLITAFTM